MSPDSRRAFLKTTCGLSAALISRGLAVSSPAAMPRIRVGGFPISRLVLGANPVWGYSYQGTMMSKFMVQYYTDANIVKLLHDAERAGINTFQTNFSKRFPEAWKRYRDEGGKIQLIILYDPKEVTIKEAVQYRPIAIIHHGGVTDTYWRSNKFQLVHDFVKEVKDAGVLAGVSCHEPQVMDRISDENWENDLFMGCFYVMSRPEADWRKILGFRPIQSMFLPTDPETMCRSIRRTNKPCLAFKILAGGWGAGSSPQTDASFKYAFQNIKPTDGVIVGMLPAFEDQIAENVACTIKHGCTGSSEPGAVHP